MGLTENQKRLIQAISQNDMLSAKAWQKTLQRKTINFVTRTEQYWKLPGQI